ncbi:MAG: FadD3 family acyl-CoA ligase [Actinobacteria bacterium]|nr:FadD3 family acyl-CoA ligase [Actinomycetota bacterium]
MATELELTTIGALVRDAAERHGEAEAVVDDTIRWSFRQLHEQVVVAAKAFLATGLERGDRVAIWAPNCHEWMVAALGALTAGGVLVPLNTRYKGHEAGYILDTSGARFLLTVSGFLDTDYVQLLRDADVDLDRFERVVILRGAATDGDATDGTQVWSAFLAGGKDVPLDDVLRRADEVRPEDTSDIIFTSGTTGRPKGVVTSHQQTLTVFEVWSRLVGLRPGDRYLVVNPFFHTFGYKAGFVSAIMRGATTIPHAVFDPATVMTRIEVERVTMLPGPPTLYQMILNHPDREKHDLSSLRLAVTGAAVVPVQLIRQMSDDLGFDVVLTAYGLTEATGVVSMCREGDDAETIANTCGTAIPDTEVRVVDQDGNAVSAGEPGEVVVRGYNVMQGYFEDPQRTAETIRDGWLHTGDIGVMDERGYLKITDRLKDMFIVGGFNAYPAEIEQALLDHPAIAQAAVVGVPDERLGEVGCAFVVPANDASVDPDEVIAWSRDRMANFKVPRRVEVVDALPTNASGKVLKTELRDRVFAS